MKEFTLFIGKIIGIFLIIAGVTGLFLVEWYYALPLLIIGIFLLWRQGK